MRRGLIVLLSLGVVVGFGSGFARMAHHAGCHEGRWGERFDGPSSGYGRNDRFDRETPPPAPAVAQPLPAVAPVYIVIPGQAPIVVNNAPAASAGGSSAPVAIPPPAPVGR